MALFYNYFNILCFLNNKVFNLLFTNSQPFYFTIIMYISCKTVYDKLNFRKLLFIFKILFNCLYYNNFILTHFVSLNL